MVDANNVITSLLLILLNFIAAINHNVYVLIANKKYVEYVNSQEILD